MENLSTKVSVVIPTLNAGRWLPRTLTAFRAQKPHPPMEVVLVDSGSRDDTLSIAAADSMVRVVPIERFTHGAARNLGIREARGDIVVLMTQDAEPADPNWLSNLLQSLEEPDVAAVYSRQIPREDASPMERFFLLDRFPAGERFVRRHRGAAPPVYPDTFFSNVSAAARRDMWMRFPFDETLLMSEDQQFTRDVLMAGLAIVYEPSSAVLHSHRYSLWQTFQRYFDSVVAFRQLSGGHDAWTSARLGKSTFFREVGYLLRNYPGILPYYGLYQLFKAGGVVAAHLADRMPSAWCARCSLQPAWWTTRAS